MREYRLRCIVYRCQSIIGRAAAHMELYIFSCTNFTPVRFFGSRFDQSPYNSRAIREFRRSTSVNLSRNAPIAHFYVLRNPVNTDSQFARQKIIITIVMMIIILLKIKSDASLLRQFMEKKIIAIIIINKIECRLTDSTRLDLQNRIIQKEGSNSTR